MNEIKCFDCDCYLDYDEMVDEVFDGCFSTSTWIGSCPECGKKYKWKEHYKFNCFDELEEVK